MTDPYIIAFQLAFGWFLSLIFYPVNNRFSSPRLATWFNYKLHCFLFIIFMTLWTLITEGAISYSDRKNNEELQQKVAILIENYLIKQYPLIKFTEEEIKYSRDIISHIIRITEGNYDQKTIQLVARKIAERADSSRTKFMLTKEAKKAYEEHKLLKNNIISQYFGVRD